MRMFVRRLEAFNRDELPAWRGVPLMSWQTLLFVPRLAEYALMYVVGLCVLAIIIALIGIGWLTGLDRGPG